MRIKCRAFSVAGNYLHFDAVLHRPLFIEAREEALESDYKRELGAAFGIVFNRLFAISNMPIHRFKAQLVRQKSYDDYMEKLVTAFNISAAEGIMCRSMVSVGFDGTLYDCDFNQMLGMTVENKSQPMTIFDFDEKFLRARKIRFAGHCFGCTAGEGSSCVGSTAGIR